MRLRQSSPCSFFHTTHSITAHSFGKRGRFFDRGTSQPCKAIEDTPDTAAAVQTTPTVQELFRFDTSVQVIPHPEKISFGGEDAFFINEDSGFGVADGVGGWREEGFNPADYSRKIMRITSECLQKTGDLTSALDEAHTKTRMPGSCTACFVTINGKTGLASGLNLGDSGFLILRENGIITRTTPQQHFFDCPMQLAAFPEHCEATDYAHDGDLFSVQLRPDDIIIMGATSCFCALLKERAPLGTDGLWDNVYEEEILTFTSNVFKPRKSVEDLAEGLARLAQRHSVDNTFKSPYTAAALDEGYDVPWYEKILKTRIVDGHVQLGTLTGGKLDDITVIVAKVRKTSSSK